MVLPVVCRPARVHNRLAALALQGIVPDDSLLKWCTNEADTQAQGEVIIICSAGDVDMSGKSSTQGRKSDPAMQLVIKKEFDDHSVREPGTLI